MSDDASTDGGESMQAHTVRLELVDEPGELLAALHPIADNGGNLLSVFHERGSVTPRGHIPVEIDLECPPDRFDDVVSGLRDAGVNVVQADAEQYGEELTVILVGDGIEAALSETLARIEDRTDATVVDFSVSGREGTEETSSARFRLATVSDRSSNVLAAVRAVANDKELHVVEPLTDGVNA